MNLNITGDPGTHNTYNEVNIHIDHVENFNPNATNVTNNYGDSGRRHEESSVTAETASPELRAVQRDDIIEYVNRLLKYVALEYATQYETLWLAILTIPEVAAEVYTPGKQQGTTFNRNLVANIIHALGHHGADGKHSIFKVPYNAAAFTEVLHGDKDHSVRAALGTPLARVIYNKVYEQLQTTLKI